ncbi:MAG: hypothetical protein RBU37_27270 [Myxococcota bacterium]|nr:hypothetical protein [Myxococcota bacterium]
MSDLRERNEPTTSRAQAALAASQFEEALRLLDGAPRLDLDEQASAIFAALCLELRSQAARLDERLANASPAVAQRVGGLLSDWTKQPTMEAQLTAAATRLARFAAGRQDRARPLWAFVAARLHALRAKVLQRHHNERARSYAAHAAAEHAFALCLQSDGLSAAVRQLVALRRAQLMLQLHPGQLDIGAAASALLEDGNAFLLPRQHRLSFAAIQLHSPRTWTRIRALDLLIELGDDGGAAPAALLRTRLQTLHESRELKRSELQRLREACERLLELEEAQRVSRFLDALQGRLDAEPAEAALRRLLDDERASMGRAGLALLAGRAECALDGDTPALEQLLCWGMQALQQRLSAEQLWSRWGAKLLGLGQQLWQESEAWGEELRCLAPFLPALLERWSGLEETVRADWRALLLRFGERAPVPGYGLALLARMAQRAGEAELAGQLMLCAGQRRCDEEERSGAPLREEGLVAWAARRLLESDREDGLLRAWELLERWRRAVE